MNGECLLCNSCAILFKYFIHTNLLSLFSEYTFCKNFYSESFVCFPFYYFFFLPLVHSTFSLPLLQLQSSKWLWKPLQPCNSKVSGLGGGTRKEWALLRGEATVWFYLLGGQQTRTFSVGHQFRWLQPLIRFTEVIKEGESSWRLCLAAA